MPCDEDSLERQKLARMYASLQTQKTGDVALAQKGEHWAASVDGAVDEGSVHGRQRTLGKASLV